MRPLPQGHRGQEHASGPGESQGELCHGTWDGSVCRRPAHQPYEQGSFSNSDPLRPKKLLRIKCEIRKLSGLVSRQGYTLIPLKVYLKDGRMKLELGLCRGKHLHDKRDAAAARDAKREMERALRQHE